MIDWYGREPNKSCINRRYCIEWAITGEINNKDVEYGTLTEMLLELRDWMKEITSGGNEEELELFFHWMDSLHEKMMNDIGPGDIDVRLSPEVDED